MISIASPHCFAQQNPAADCKNAVWNTVESLHRDYEVKCPDPRCSYECNARWSWRHWTCVHRLLHDHLPENMVVHRGHLKMAKDATPDQHKTCKKEFLRILDRWRKSTGHTLEIHAVLHIDDYLNAHWDTIAYSDSPIRPLKLAVSDAWTRAGGRSQSLVKVDDDELIASLKYQVKDTVRPDRAKGFLPAKRNEMGMNHHWSTRPTKLSKGFWRGSSEHAMWQEWKEENIRDLGGVCPMLDMKSRTKHREKMTAQLKALTPYSEDYLKLFEWYTPEVK